MVEELVYYPDPSYIMGRFRRKARAFFARKKRDKKTKIKVDNGIEKTKFKFIISQLSEMEIKKTLMGYDNLTFEQANEVFNEVIKETPNYSKVVEEVKITPGVCNNVCSKKLDLCDILHILIAARLKLFIVTKESNLEKWKKVYDCVLSPNEFQERIKAKQSC